MSIGMDTDSNRVQYEEEEDEVLQEFDVYLAGGLADQLHLLQHPVRLRRYGRNLEPKEVYYKEKYNRLQFELPINTSSQAYDADRGRELARAMGLKRDPIQSRSFSMMLDETQSDPIMERVMISSLPMPMMTNYMVGVLRQDGLHLTPIKAAHQLRPSFQHLDQLDEYEKRNHRKYEEEDKTEDEKQQAQLGQAKTVQVKVKSIEEMEKVRQERNTSQVYLQQKVNEEPWVKLSYDNVEVSDLLLSFFSILIFD
jgi:DNA-directed RNA polymerase-3 subunit RPC5